MKRSLSRRQRIVRAITNPDTIFSRNPEDDAPPRPPPTSKFDSARINESKFARAFFSPTLDVGVTNHKVLTSVPATVREALDPDDPIWPPHLLQGYIDSCVGEFAMPDGYSVRPLCKADYHRGYLDVLRVQEKVGWVTEVAWDERCEWLHDKGDGTYYTVVIYDKAERCVAAGTLLVERKFTRSLGMVGHFEDIAISRDQKGKKMGIRILEALLHVAQEVGCHQTIVQCNEQNENFYAQVGFRKEGSHMTQKFMPNHKREDDLYSTL